MARVVRDHRPVLILGDFVNFVDYRTGAGVAQELFGDDFVTEVRRLRAANDYDGSRALWRSAAEDRNIDIRKAAGRILAEQYEACRAALEGAQTYVIHGNVDNPEILKAHLPEGSEYVHGKVIELEGWRIGFAAGGAETPLHTPGETTDEEMAAVLEDLGPVDVLCTHIPPAVEPLCFDTVTGQVQRASRPILDYLRTHQPRFHFFGDIHQPRALRWSVAGTACINVGYFRATGRGHVLDPAT